LSEFMDSPGMLYGQVVLIVDDDPDTCWLLRMLLEGHGATVSTAGSADEALSSFEQQVPDVIISDLRMPIRDGHDLIREIRAREAGSDRRVPAIAATAFGQAEMRNQALESGFDFVLVKPITIDELVEAIGRLVRPIRARTA